MSTMSEEARSAAKSKAERLTKSDPHMRVDASGYSPEGPMDAGEPTGMRPVTRRQFRRGGKVAGEAAPARADRKPRASGGSIDSYINRDVKAANKERPGINHDGGMKAGGRTGKYIGGPMGTHPMARPAPVAARPGMRPMLRKDGGKVHADEAQDRKLMKEVIHKSGCSCSKCSGGRVGRARGGPAINDGTRPVAGRLARKGGGRTKGKTNVNIIIAPQGGGAAAARPPMPPPGIGAPPPGAGPVGMHQGAPPPPPVGVMPPGAPPMMRKDGGRTLEKNGGKLLSPKGYPIETGAGGALGRLEKAARARP